MGGSRRLNRFVIQQQHAEIACYFNQLPECLGGFNPRYLCNLPPHRPLWAACLSWWRGVPLSWRQLPACRQVPCGICLRTQGLTAQRSLVTHNPVWGRYIDMLACLQAEMQRKLAGELTGLLDSSKGIRSAVDVVIGYQQRSDSGRWGLAAERRTAGRRPAAALEQTEGHSATKRRTCTQPAIAPLACYALQC